MKIFYRGFEGELTLDMDTGIYHIGGQHPDGHVATAECTITQYKNGYDVCYEFKKSVDICLEDVAGIGG